MLPTMLALAANPPQPIIPALGDALIGWLLGLAVLLGPLALVAVSWQRRHGPWWSCLTQWNTLAFWLVAFGAVIAAGGMFALLGIVPAWQTAWNAWYLQLATSKAVSDPAVLTWLQAAQTQYAFALQVCAASVFLVGAGAVVIGQMRLARRLTTFRHEGPDDWLNAPAEVTAPAMSQTGRRLTRPLTAQT